MTVALDRQLDEYARRALGAELGALTTPALLVDLPTVRRNISLAAGQAAGRVALRPHAKTHKAVELTRLQVAAGAVGVTTATIWEAAAMARGGIGDILVANEIVGREKVEVAAEIAGTTRLAVAIDDLRNARDLAAAARAAGTRIRVLVDVDNGMNRCGVRSPAEARALAEEAAALDGLEFEGVTGYEGQCVQIPDREERRRKTLAALGVVVAAVEAIRDGGLDVRTVSAGGTGTHDVTAGIAGVTELQLGSYVFLDTNYVRLTPEFEIALTVLATVVSRHDGTVVLDCGSKTISAEHAPPAIVGHDASLRYLAEEHAVFDAGPGCRLDLGDRVRVATGHCCATTNLHRVHHAVADDVVEEIWPIVGRGPGGRGS